MGSDSPISLAQLRDLAFRRCGVGICVTDRDGRYVEINQAYCDIYGFDREALIGQHFTMVVPPEQREAVRALYDQTIASGTSCTSERRVQRRDGMPLDVAVTSSVFAAPTGERYKLVTAQDVTARVQAQQALRTTLSRLAEAERIAHMGHWQWDLTTGEEHWSDETCRLFGLVPGAFKPGYAAFLEMIHPQDRDAVIAAERQALSGAGPFEVVYRVVRGDGTIRVLQSRGEATFDRDGTPNGLIGTVLDITERVAAEQALRESEERFRVALQSSPIAVFNQDRELRYTWIQNPQYHAVAEMLGKTDRDLLPAGSALLLEELKRQVLDSGCGVRQEVAVRHRDDVEPEYYDLTIEPMRDAAGAVTGITCAAVNVTEDRRIKQALETARAEAERASAAKTRFLAAASHDLRQPLQACILFQDLLERRNRDPALGEIVAKLGQSLAGLQDLFNQLLDISRLDAGTVKPECKDFAIGPLLEDLVRELRPQAEACGLALDLAGARPVVRSDPQLLQRILRNLLDNAIKYTSRGRILLGCRRAGDSLRIQVWDTGVGIPADRLPAAFEEFRQLEMPAGGRGRGLGLGLAIVDRLARLLGHQVTVRSTPGRGSCFEVRVALAAAAPQRPVARTPLVGVIDDDAAVREALQLCLEAAGHEVVAGADGAEVLAALERLARPPDAIIADGRLRNGSAGGASAGREAILTARSRWQRAIPGILLVDGGMLERSGPGSQPREGDLFLLHKPIVAEALIALLDQVVTERQAGGTPRPAGRTGRLVPDGPIGEGGRKAVRR